MPLYTVTFECRVHGSCTIEADDEDDARQKFDLDHEGVELDNINELYASEATSTDATYFQES